MLFKRSQCLSLSVNIASLTAILARNCSSVDLFSSSPIIGVLVASRLIFYFSELRVLQSGISPYVYALPRLPSVPSPCFTTTSLPSTTASRRAGKRREHLTM